MRIEGGLGGQPHDQLDHVDIDQRMTRAMPAMALRRRTWSYASAGPIPWITASTRNAHQRGPGWRSQASPWVLATSTPAVSARSQAGAYRSTDRNRRYSACARGGARPINPNWRRADTTAARDGRPAAPGIRDTRSTAARTRARDSRSAIRYGESPNSSSPPSPSSITPTPSDAARAIAAARKRGWARPAAAPSARDTEARPPRHFRCGPMPESTGDRRYGRDARRGRTHRQSDDPGRPPSRPFADGERRHCSRGSSATLPSPALRSA